MQYIIKDEEQSGIREDTVRRRTFGQRYGRKLDAWPQNKNSTHNLYLGSDYHQYVYIYIYREREKYIYNIIVKVD